jgi:hypothetical protein
MLRETLIKTLPHMAKMMPIRGFAVAAPESGVSSKTAPRNWSKCIKAKM